MSPVMSHPPVPGDSGDVACDGADGPSGARNREPRSRLLGRRGRRRGFRALLGDRTSSVEPDWGPDWEMQGTGLPERAQGVHAPPERAGPVAGSGQPQAAQPAPRRPWACTRSSPRPGAVVQGQRRGLREAARVRPALARPIALDGATSSSPTARGRAHVPTAPTWRSRCRPRRTCWRPWRSAMLLPRAPSTAELIAPAVPAGDGSAAGPASTCPSPGAWRLRRAARRPTRQPPCETPHPCDWGFGVPAT